MVEKNRFLNALDKIIHGFNPAILLLVGCLAIFAFFAFDHFNARPFWGDEAAVALVVASPSANFFEKAAWDGHPLAYIIPLKIWALFLGNGETSLRCFSAIFAFLLIILLYRVGQEFFSRTAGLLAAFLGSVNYFLIWFADQARPYTMIAFLGLASFYFLVRLTKPERKKIDWFFYGLSTLLALHAHPWLVLVFCSQILLVVISRKDVFRPDKILISQAVLVLLSLPYFIWLFYLSHQGINYWIPVASPSVIWESFSHLSSENPWLYLIIVVISLIGSVFHKTVGGNHGRKTVFLGLWLYLLFPIISAFLISLFKPLYVPGRYEIAVLPAFILLISSVLAKVEKEYLLLPAFFFLLFTFNSVSADRLRVAGYKTNDRMIAEEILSQLKNGDAVITTDMNWQVFSYYLPRLNQGAKKFDLISFPEEITQHPGWRNLPKMISEKEKYEKEADELIGFLKTKDGAAIWLLYYESDPLNLILYDRLNQNFSLEKEERPPIERENSWLNKIIIFRQSK